jgi:hypothetical protein
MPNVADCSASDSFCAAQLSKLATRVIFMDNLALEVNMVLRASDRRKPRGIVLLSILEQLNVVAVDQGRTGCSRERLLGESPDRRQAGTLDRLVLNGTHSIKSTLDHENEGTILAT